MQMPEEGKERFLDDFLAILWRDTKRKQVAEQRTLKFIEERRDFVFQRGRRLPRVRGRIPDKILDNVVERSNTRHPRNSNRRAGCSARPRPVSFDSIR